jgi:hypothetical protein
MKENNAKVNLFHSDNHNLTTYFIFSNTAEIKTFFV